MKTLLNDDDWAAEYSTWIYLRNEYRKKQRQKRYADLIVIAAFAIFWAWFIITCLKELAR